MKQNNDEKGLSQIHFGDKTEGYKSSKKKSGTLLYICDNFSREETC